MPAQYSQRILGTQGPRFSEKAFDSGLGASQEAVYEDRKAQSDLLPIVGMSSRHAHPATASFLFAYVLIDGGASRQKVNVSQS